MKPGDRDYSLRPAGEIDRHGDGRQVVLARVVEVDGDGTWESGKVRVYGVKPLKGVFDLAAGLQDITSSLRLDTTFYAAVPQGEASYAENDIVIVAKSGRRWWIIGLHGTAVISLFRVTNVNGVYGGPLAQVGTGVRLTVEGGEIDPEPDEEDLFPGGVFAGRAFEDDVVVGVIRSDGSGATVIAGGTVTISGTANQDVTVGPRNELGVLTYKVGAVDLVNGETLNIVRFLASCKEGDTVLVWWDVADGAWWALPVLDIPSGGSGDPDCCANGGGGPAMPGPDDGGFPRWPLLPGGGSVECNRAECCDDDDPELTIVACEHCDTAPSRYAVTIGTMEGAENAEGWQALDHDAECNWYGETFDIVQGENTGQYRWEHVIEEDCCEEGGGAAWGEITGTLADQEDLQGELDDKLEAADIADFETTTELNTRDTNNRARANHTGTQAISTVSGLQTELDGKSSTSHTHAVGDLSNAENMQTWVPELRASTTNPTLGTGSIQTGHYTVIDQLVIAHFRIVFGSTGMNVGSGTYRISVPVDPDVTSYPFAGCGNALVINGGSLPVLVLLGDVAGEHAYVGLRRADGSSNISSTSPTWGAGDSLQGTFMYKKAAA